MLARPGDSRLDHTGGERLRQNSAPWDLAEDHDNRVRSSLGDATAATVYEHGHLEDLHAHAQDPQSLAKALVNAGRRPGDRRLPGPRHSRLAPAGMMEGMHSLIAFLRSRLDEDEQIARAAAGGPWTVDSAQHAGAIMGPGGIVVIGGARRGGQDTVLASAEDAVHIARHDPARVLSEIYAKRMLLEASNATCPTECALEHSFSGSCGLRWMGPACEADGQRWLQDDTGARFKAPPVTSEWVLRILALPFTGHPDYRSEWRP